MKTIQGHYSEAIVFTDLIEETAISQIQTLCDQPFVKNCKIRVMPDVHAGSGCVIGFTADLGELVIPNIVGVDIGCGMLTIELGKSEPDYELLDRTIHEDIPAGMAVYDEPVATFDFLDDLLCVDQLKNLSWIKCSIGTLGGGNHFIEIDKDDEETFYLVIHTGSRNLGKQVAEYYQQLAIDKLIGKLNPHERQRKLIEEYKASGRSHEIQSALREMKTDTSGGAIPKELCYLAGDDRNAYLHDMRLCQEYAKLNRRIIAERILKKVFHSNLEAALHFETIHNYIDLESNVIRKGAVSAKLGQQLIIPINMRDGSLICIGKGNQEWNCSAPHGAGRLFSRAEARRKFTVSAYANEMDGIYTSSVCEETLDECPMAYKPIQSILENISPTVDVVKVIRPTYNFKAAD